MDSHTLLLSSVVWIPRFAVAVGVNETTERNKWMARLDDPGRVFPPVADGCLLRECFVGDIRP